MCIGNWGFSIVKRLAAQRDRVSFQINLKKAIDFSIPFTAYTVKISRSPHPRIVKGRTFFYFYMYIEIPICVLGNMA